jgi:hypothetical protein
MTKNFVILIFLSFLSSCATYQSRVDPARDQIKNKQCEPGLKLLNELSQKADGDQLVYLMEYGSALQICKEYEKSNQTFIKADKLSDELDYHSATRVVGATLLNEEMIQYKGDTFEKLFINASAALNYLQLGEFDDALVEVRRINDKFNKLNSDQKKKFELNSFSQYLSGLIWEIDQKYDDACISYKTAYKIDSSYRGVALDTLKGCWLAKRTLDFDLLSKEINPTEEELKQIKQKSKSEIIIIFMQGWGPRKAPRPENRNFPYLSPVTSLTQALQLEVDNHKFVSQPVYSVEKAAIETLNADFTYLISRRVGARVTKAIVADQIRQNDKVLGEIAHLVMLASEKADLRQWSMLPQTIQVIRYSGPTANQNFKLTGLNQSGSPIEDLGTIEVGVLKKKKIFLVRSLK